MRFRRRDSWLVAGALLVGACSTQPQVPPQTSTSTTETTTAAGSSVTASASSSALIRATTDRLADPEPPLPADLVRTLRGGGNVIVFRYTGAEVPANPGPAARGTIDDGQRISAGSRRRLTAMGSWYRSQRIPVGSILSSEYFFVLQHAQAAFGNRVGLNRDLTGSLNFTDPQELRTSLQGLRDRTVTPPPAGTNTVLFTHQGKFDKAYGYYPDAGTTLVFRPDGSGTPRLLANVPLDTLMGLKG